MQDYISLRIDATPCNADITDLLAAFLGDVGFESFSPDATGLTSYVKAEDYDSDAVARILCEFPIEASFSSKSELIEGKTGIQNGKRIISSRLDRRRMRGAFFIPYRCAENTL